MSGLGKTVITTGTATAAATTRTQQTTSETMITHLVDDDLGAGAPGVPTSRTVAASLAMWRWLGGAVNVNTSGARAPRNGRGRLRSSAMSCDAWLKIVINYA